MSSLTTVLLNLFVIYAAAKAAGVIAAHLGQPGVIGELVAGIVIGPHALGLIGEPSSDLTALFGGNRDEAAHALDLVLESVAELGVVVLLFTVGLETRLTDILRVGGRAALVGVLGIAVPFVLGFAFMEALGHPRLESAFVATALVATSVGITARILQDLGALRDREARVILGAAVIDDILGLLLLAVVSAAGSGSGVAVGDLVVIAVQAVAFVGFIAWMGTHATRRFSVRLQALDARSSVDVPLTVSLLLMLGLAVVAGLIGLAGIIGAFLAGMVLAESGDQLNLEARTGPIVAFLAPFFFVYTGAKVDPGAATDAGVLALAVGVIVLAVAGKLVGAGGAMWGSGWWSMAVVGVGMVPRGEVGLIVAGLGLSLGIVSGDIFSVVVLMSIATTLIAPPLISALYRRRRVRTVTERGETAAVPPP